MYWSWKTGGIALGLTFFAAVLLVKPIGVSTQFVIVDAIAARAVAPALVVEDPGTKTGYGSPNAYLSKSGGKYARAVAHPVTYGLVFVVAMFLGGLIGRWRGRRAAGSLSPDPPEHHVRRFGATPVHRFLLAAGGGFLVLWGARLAGGCTSGHMMSGIMQTSLSGYAFALAVFAAGVPVAILLYGPRGDRR